MLTPLSYQDTCAGMEKCIHTVNALQKKQIDILKQNGCY